MTVVRMMVLTRHGGREKASQLVTFCVLLPPKRIALGWEDSMFDTLTGRQQTSSVADLLLSWQDCADCDA
eukprot:9366991-Ditylum_brightwellii.AAC.1